MAKRTCDLPECDGPYHSKGLCSRHARAKARYGDPRGRAPKRAKPKCSVDECERASHARTFCNKHYLRWKTWGDPLKGPYRQDPECSIDGCNKPSLARGWCSMHWTRWQRNGDPLEASYIRQDDERRFWSYIDGPNEDGCIEWTGFRDHLGYGTWQFMVETNSRKAVPAHRAVYERTVGPIPDGLHLDHLCRNPSCVNPDHLEPVTCAVNVRRGAATRLTEQDAREIRHLADTTTLTYRAIGERFGVTATHAWRIATGQAWRMDNEATT